MIIEAVYVFRDYIVGSNIHAWSLLARLSPNSRVDGDLYGWSLTFAIGNLYVGAPGRKIIDTG